MTVFHGQELDKAIEDILVRSAGLPADVVGTGTGETTLEELGLDSLACMELQAVLKDRYGVRIPEESLEMSIPQIAAYVNKALEETN